MKKFPCKIGLIKPEGYKNALVLDNTFQPDIKDIILETSVPKFIRVCEISDKAMIKQRQANGIIIVDATEANIFALKPLIPGAFSGILLSHDKTNGVLSKKDLPLYPFPIFTNNLKGF